MTSTTARTFTPPQLKPATVLLSMAAIVVFGLALGLLMQPSTNAAAKDLPAGFPIPAEARQIEGQGEVVTLEVPGTAQDVHAFYAKALVDKGWKAEAWEGTDPNGAAATGFIVERGTKDGALSIVQNGPAVTVEINMTQPTVNTDGAPGSHGAHDAPAKK